MTLWAVFYCPQERIDSELINACEIVVGEDGGLPLVFNLKKRTFPRCFMLFRGMNFIVPDDMRLDRHLMRDSLLPAPV